MKFCNSNNIRIHRTPRSEFISSTKIRKDVEFWNNIQIKDNPNATMLTSPNQQEETKKEIELISKHLNKTNVNILDLGSGNGRLSIPFMDNNNVTCVDSSKNLIEDLKSKTKIEKHQNFFLEDVIDFSKREKSEKYEVIIASGILQSFDDNSFGKLTKDIKRMLKKEGILLVRVSVSNIGKKISVINQFSDMLNSLYTAYYRTIEEIDLAFKEFEKQEEIFLYANHADTKIMFLKYKKN